MALCGVLALAGLLGAGQALAASSPPFVDNGDGTVTDASTGLLWAQCTWGQTGNGTCTGGAASRHTWDAAFTQAAAANATAGGHKGYADWRLPSKKELLTHDE